MAPADAETCSAAGGVGAGRHGGSSEQKATSFSWASHDKNEAEMSTATCGSQWLCYHGNGSARVPCGPLHSLAPGTQPRLGDRQAQALGEMQLRVHPRWGREHGRRAQTGDGTEFKTFCKWQREGKKER